MPAQIHQYDIGTQFKILVKNQDDEVVDISAATTKEIIFLKPDGAKLTKTASFITNGTDGYLEYVGVSGFLDVIGIWSLNAYIIQSGTAFYTDIKTFKVFGNL